MFLFFYLINRYQCWPSTLFIFKLLPPLCVSLMPLVEAEKAVKPACVGPKKKEQKKTQEKVLGLNTKAFICRINSRSGNDHMKG